MRKSLVLLSFVVALLSCSQQPVSAVIITEDNGEIINFAKAELEKFSEEAGIFNFYENEDAQWQFYLKVDKTMEPYSFSYKSEFKEGKNQVTLKGAEPASLLHSVYSFLEKGGYLFEITRATLAHGFSIDKIKNIEEEIEHVVKKRGIRQHINFPMDISSYTLEDAKAYIQNLSRMRFNFIVFHSYPGMWHEEPGSERFEYAGNFFYGHRHDILDNPNIKNKITDNNKK